MTNTRNPGSAGSKWEYFPEHDAWGKRVTFEATPGRRRNTYDVAVRRERKGSKLWRADLYSMMGWEALTPTPYRRVPDAKKDIDHILAAYSKVRHDPHNDEDIQAVAHYVMSPNSHRDPLNSHRDPLKRPARGMTLHQTYGIYSAHRQAYLSFGLTWSERRDDAREFKNVLAAQRFLREQDMPNTTSADVARGAYIVDLN